MRVRWDPEVVRTALTRLAAAIALAAALAGCVSRSDFGITDEELEQMVDFTHVKRLKMELVVDGEPFTFDRYALCRSSLHKKLGGPAAPTLRVDRPVLRQTTPQGGVIVVQLGTGYCATLGDVWGKGLLPRPQTPSPDFVPVFSYLPQPREEPRDPDQPSAITYAGARALSRDNVRVKVKQVSITAIPQPIPQEALATIAAQEREEEPLKRPYPDNYVSEFIYAVEIPEARWREHPSVVERIAALNARDVVSAVPTLKGKDPLHRLARCEAFYSSSHDEGIVQASKPQLGLLTKAKGRIACRETQTAERQYAIRCTGPLCRVAYDEPGVVAAIAMRNPTHPDGKEYFFERTLSIRGVKVPLTAAWTGTPYFFDHRTRRLVGVIGHSP